MAIPESQLQTWSNQGAVATSSSTYSSIRTALEATTSPIRTRNYEIFLQGSYKNSTNIRGDSDVDIVVQLNATFDYYINPISIPLLSRNLIIQEFEPVTYTWDNFRTDVFSALQNYYGSSAITQGRKSIKVRGGSGRLPADVVVALQYRNYISHAILTGGRFVEGISFYALPERRQIINYPKSHYDNGVAKNAVGAANGLYKPTIRMFKNARSHLVSQGTISSDLAPSYFLECLLYNVPNDIYRFSFSDIYPNLVNWLWQANMNSFMCQNEQLSLFGASQEQWIETSARQLNNGLINLWNQW